MFGKRNFLKQLGLQRVFGDTCSSFASDRASAAATEVCEGREQESPVGCSAWLSISIPPKPRNL